MARVLQNMRFLWQYLRKPLTTGAIAPSSPDLARAIVGGLGLSEADTIAEFGAGTGVFTQVIRQTAGPNAKILVFEINPSMAAMLRQNLPPVEVITDSAANLGRHLKERDLDSVDCVVCGLPWASFSDELQDAILQALVENLCPGGRFATFAYVHACWFPTAKRFRAKLGKLFTRVEASQVVWGNVPPAFVWRCTK